MPLRKINLPSDIDLLIHNTLTSFTYPDHPEWNLQEDEKTEILDQIQAMKRYWPLIAVLRLFLSGIRDILLGYIWEEEGCPAGSIMYQRRSDGNYYINSIAVLPEFRRRGIARKMLTAVLEEAAKKRAKKVRLDVIKDNLPARSLYEHLGFISFRTFNILTLPPNPELPPAAAALNGYEEKPLKNSDWKPVFDLNERIISEDVRLYEPPNPVVYQQSGFQNFINTILGSRTRKIIIRETNSGQVCAYCKYTYRTRPGGLNHMFFQLDPAASELAPYLIQSQLHRMLELSPARRTEINIPDRQEALLQAAVQAGFRKQQEYCRMGLLLSEN